MFVGGNQSHGIARNNLLWLDQALKPNLEIWLMIYVRCYG